MAYIKVNHQKLETTASQVDSYVSAHKRNMNSMGNMVSGLSSSWEGKDFTEVQNQWNEINAKDSSSGKMISSLENYADFLRYAAKKYKEVQTNAVNRANSLPRY